MEGRTIEGKHIVFAAIVAGLIMLITGVADVATLMIAAFFGLVIWGVIWLWWNGSGTNTVNVKVTDERSYEDRIPKTRRKDNDGNWF